MALKHQQTVREQVDSAEQTMHWDTRCTTVLATHNPTIYTQAYTHELSDAAIS